MRLSSRLLRLMSFIRWRDISDWDQVDARLKTAEILPFCTWLKENIVYLPETHGDAVLSYYLEETTTNRGGVFNVQLREAHIALRALYAKEREHERRDY